MLPNGKHDIVFLQHVACVEEPVHSCHMSAWHCCLRRVTDIQIISCSTSLVEDLNISRLFKALNWKSNQQAKTKLETFYWLTNKLTTTNVVKQRPRRHKPWRTGGIISNCQDQFLNVTKIADMCILSRQLQMFVLTQPNRIHRYLEKQEALWPWLCLQGKRPWKCFFSHHDFFTNV